MADISYQTVGQNVGAAASDLFSGIGNFQAAASYRGSAKSFRKNASLEKQSGAIKDAQVQRELFKVIGGQRADVASSGFSSSGTALDLLRDSQRQGGLVAAQTKLQTAINVETYEGQAKSAESQANAEDTAGLGNIVGAVASTALAVLPFLLLSDRRLKVNIRQLGVTENGLPWYEFSYLGTGIMQEGLMSDDVRAFRPEAVEVGADGYDRVNYALALKV